MNLEFICKQTISVLQSFENRLARISKEIHHLLGFVTLVTSLRLSGLHDWDYGFTSCYKHLAVSDTILNHVSIHTGALSDVTMGSCLRAISVASKADAKSTLTTVSLFRVLGTHSVAVHQKVSSNTLMTLTRSAKFSDCWPVCYWLHTSSLTITRCS